MNFDTLVRFDRSYNTLSSSEVQWLRRTVESVEQFVKKSRAINKQPFATRNAHAQTFSVLRGYLFTNDDLPAQVRSIFDKENYKVLVRYSHGNPLIRPVNKFLPAYGMAIKIYSDGEEWSFPLVNFPIFPIKSGKKVLQIFTNFNAAVSSATKTKRTFSLARLLKNIVSVVPSALSWSMLKNTVKLLFRKNQSAIGFPYYSVGVYRMGSYMMKLKATPSKKVPLTNTGDHQSSIEQALSSGDVHFDLTVQLCADLQNQPVNDLSVEWKNAPEFTLGRIQFTKGSLKDSSLIPAHKTSFNPFENPQELQPVGQIQYLRKDVYDASISTRRAEE